MAGTADKDGNVMHAPIALVLAWLIPGLGHIYLGHKGRGIICLVAITLTFWTGVAIGGVKSVHQFKPVPRATADEEDRRGDRSWWFFAQICNGAYAVTAYTIGQRTGSYLSWPSGDVASVYSGIAGLLNILVILDALGRAEGLPGPGRPPPRRRPTGGAAAREGRRSV